MTTRAVSRPAWHRRKRRDRATARTLLRAISLDPEGLQQAVDARRLLDQHHSAQQPPRMSRRQSLQQQQVPQVNFENADHTWECFRCHNVNPNNLFTCSGCGARWSAKAASRGRSPASAAAGAAEWHDISTPRRAHSPGRRRRQQLDGRGDPPPSAPRQPKAPTTGTEPSKASEPAPWRSAPDQ